MLTNTSRNDPAGGSAKGKQRTKILRVSPGLIQYFTEKKKIESFAVYEPFSTQNISLSSDMPGSCFENNHGQS